jgi:hypothetical protein
VTVARTTTRECDLTPNPAAIFGEMVIPRSDTRTSQMGGDRSQSPGDHRPRVRLGAGSPADYTDSRVGVARCSKAFVRHDPARISPSGSAMRIMPSGHKLLLGKAIYRSCVPLQPSHVVGPGTAGGAGVETAALLLSQGADPLPAGTYTLHFKLDRDRWTATAAGDPAPECRLRQYRTCRYGRARRSAVLLRSLAGSLSSPWSAGCIAATLESSPR